MNQTASTQHFSFQSCFNKKARPVSSITNKMSEEADKQVKMLLQSDIEVARADDYMTNITKRPTTRPVSAMKMKRGSNMYFL